MNTVNIILMVILAAMIGFAIGNVWGKEVMRRIMQGLINQVIDGLKMAAEANVKHEDKKGE